MLSELYGFGHYLWFRWFWFRLNLGHWVVVMGAGHPVFGLPGWLGR